MIDWQVSSHFKRVNHRDIIYCEKMCYSLPVLVPGELSSTFVVVAGAVNACSCISILGTSVRSPIPAISIRSLNTLNVAAVLHSAEGHATAAGSVM